MSLFSPALSSGLSPNERLPAFDRFTVVVSDPHTREENSNVNTSSLGYFNLNLGLQNLGLNVGKIGTYVSYKISLTLETNGAPAESLSPYSRGGGLDSSSSYPSSRQSSVFRRYSDFVTLRSLLVSACKREYLGALIPPLPEKTAIGRFNPETIEERRRALQLFLFRILAHPHLRTRQELSVFFFGDDADMKALGGSSVAAPATADSVTLEQQPAQSSWMSYLSASFNKVAKAIKPRVPRAPSTDTKYCSEAEVYCNSLLTSIRHFEAVVDSWIQTQMSSSTACNELASAAIRFSALEGQGKPQLSAEEQVDAQLNPDAYAAASAAMIPAPFLSPSNEGLPPQTRLGMQNDPSTQFGLYLFSSTLQDHFDLLNKKTSEETKHIKLAIRDYARITESMLELLRARADALEEYDVILDSIEKHAASLQEAQAGAGSSSRIQLAESSIESYQKDSDAKNLQLGKFTAGLREEYTRFRQDMSDSLKDTVHQFIKIQREFAENHESKWSDLLKSLKSQQHLHDTSMNPSNSSISESATGRSLEPEIELDNELAQQFDTISSSEDTTEQDLELEREINRELEREREAMRKNQAGR